MLLAFAVTLAACAASAPPPLPAHVGAAQARWPGTTQAELERGRTTYLRRCGACHRLHPPDDVLPARWPDVLSKMAPRAKLSPSETTDVLRYLVALASVPN